MTTAIINKLTAAQKQKLSHTLYEVFERYRYYKTISIKLFESTEGSVDPADNMVDVTEIEETQEYRQRYMTTIEYCVARLPDNERDLVHFRYMKDDYVRDHHVYECKLLIGYELYAKRRYRAFIKLAAMLNIDYGQVPPNNQ